MLTIDKIAYDSRLLTVSPKQKTLFYLVSLGLCFFTGPHLQVAIILIMAVLTIYTAKVTVRRYLKWLLIPLPFLAISFVTIVLTVAPDQQALLVSLPFFGNHLGVSTVTLKMAEKLFFRSFSCLTCTYFYALSVPFMQILQVMKACHLPAVLIEVTLLMYRFIFIFLDEVSVLRKSQELRFGYHGLKNSYRSLGLMLQLLFQQTFTRCQRMTVALEMKFFTGDFPL